MKQVSFLFNRSFFCSRQPIKETESCEFVSKSFFIGQDLFFFCEVDHRKKNGAIPNFATEKEQKRNFLDFNDVTLVVVDIKSERFVKSTCLQQDLFDMTMVTIMFDTKTSESESFIDRSIEGIINIMMEFHHF